MPAYIIVTARISNPLGFRAYAERASHLVTQYGGRYLVLGATTQALEGGDGDVGTKWVISEWPDSATARKFWDSADYAEVKKLRDGMGQFEVRLLEGLPPVALSPEKP
jgi:uncharacterized protein (DUF1330 family)